MSIPDKLSNRKEVNKHPIMINRQEGQETHIKLYNLKN